MDKRPPQPPAGKLIADAAKERRLSIREASRRADISYGRWRQIVAGYQNVSPGSYAAVRAPAATLARMARAAGVTPAQLETEGERPDAAQELRKLLHTAPLETAPSSRRNSLLALDDPLLTALFPSLDASAQRMVLVLDKLKDGDGHPLPDETKLELIRLWIGRHGSGRRAAGLAAPAVSPPVSQTGKDTESAQ